MGKAQSPSTAFDVDPLTGLSNRFGMFRDTRAMIDASPTTEFVFLRCDIDNFSLFNSAFGETEGDALLCYLAREFDDIAEGRETCTYGHINADVFAACAPYSGNPEMLRDVVEGIQRKLNAYRRSYLIEISVGVYIISDRSLSMEEIYRRASLGTQNCKGRYGHHIGYYDNRMAALIATEVEIAGEMEDALKNGCFEVFYQPKMDVSTRQACGAEALVRWRHPKKGLISPGDFIPVFERNGFIAKLDQYVWETTCKVMAQWVDTGKTPLPVSVNVSRISLHNPQLTDLFLDLIAKYDLDIDLLQLELTESAYMTNPELMKATIHKLHQAGFTILIDDFGSGYSSLNTLKDIDVDILKVDMRFLPVSDEVEKGEIVLASVVKMARWLGISVVVEGVETKVQLDFLESIGCECIQGFYYAKPMPQHDYEYDYAFAEFFQREEVDETEHVDDATVLVVDDSPIERALIASLIDRRFHIHECESAEDGMLYLRHHADQVRLILLDNSMPGMSGLDFLVYCQDDPALRIIPQIMISASQDVADQVQAFTNGAFDYIAKPLVREVFTARVNHVLDVSRMYRNLESIEALSKQSASTDLQTGLLTRGSFDELVGRYLVNHPDDQVAVLAFGVREMGGEHLPENEAETQEVAKVVAHRLSVAFRKEDYIARTSFDEFAVMMVNPLSASTSEAKAETVALAVSSDITLSTHSDKQIGIGVAFRKEGDNVDSLTAKAGGALLRNLAHAPSSAS